jgi:2-oxoglutarate ferredoxin oxidoreductase subunit delta
VTDKQASTKQVKGTIIISSEMCKGCELCISFCPKSAIKLSEKLNAAGYPNAVFTENGQCTGCAICALVCPEVAIEVYRD